jgi:hypothetical protein
VPVRATDATGGSDVAEQLAGGHCTQNHRAQYDLQQLYYDTKLHGSMRNVAASVTGSIVAPREAVAGEGLHAESDVVGVGWRGQEGARP